MSEPPVTSNPNFLGVFESGYGNYEQAAFVIVPAPYEYTVTYGQGARYGPQGIITASYEVELEDDEFGIETYRLAPVHTVAPYGPTAPPEDYLKGLEAYIARFARPDKFIITLGGEHSISEAPLRAMAKLYGEFSVLQIDAHANLREEYRGSKFSHACAGRRMMHYAKKLVQVGVRCITRQEKEHWKSGKVKTFLMHENRDVKALIPKMLAELEGPVYIAIDVDGFDPSVVPGTGTPVPGGFGWYDVLDILRETVRHKTVIGADVTELAPIPDSSLSEFTIALLIYKLMTYVTAKKLGKLGTPPKKGLKIKK